VARGRPPVVVQLPADQPRPVPPADGRERIFAVRFLADRAIVGTTTGRICAIDLATAQPLWQTRLSSSRAIQQVLANEEFIGVRLPAENNTSQIIVLDAFDGQQVYRRTFTAGANNAAINCILSPDGILVWIAPQEVAAKDLYEAGDEPTWSKPASGRSYSGTTYSDQLALWNQQVLILCDNGRMIEPRWLRTGAVAGQLLNTIASSATDPKTADPTTTRLRVYGNRLFAIGADAGVSYDMDTAASGAIASTAMIPRGDAGLPLEMAITRDYVIVPGRSQGEGGTYVIDAYNRSIIPAHADIKATESGRHDYNYRFKPAQPVQGWAVLDGGIYYLSDNKLHWLQGSKE
jgi:hypothetical protein